MSMKMMPQAEQEMRRIVANLLLRVAATLQANEKAEWKSFPPASKDGEHLRGRTWNARDNLVYAPTSPQEVAENLEVRIGYRRNAWYAAWWEVSGRRVGLREKLRQFQNSGALGAFQGSYVT